MRFNLRARLTAEFLGNAFLVAAVIGSVIMGERLASGNVAIALLTNTIATGAALAALILMFGPIPGAHLNPPLRSLTQWSNVRSGTVRAKVHPFNTASRVLPCRLGWAKALKKVVTAVGIEPTTVCEHPSSNRRRESLRIENKDRIFTTFLRFHTHEYAHILLHAVEPL
jgi:hypothetical protein